jgi:hypothetical protein
MTKQITRNDIDTIIAQAGDHFATVEFTKKDGSLRKMNFRVGVKKHLKGGESTVAHKTNLVSVYDVQAKGYRVFNKNTAKRLVVNGEEYIVEEE